MYNDAAIANKVREAILLNPRVSAQDIVITCEDRVVTLSGDVDTPEQVEEAVRAAAEVEGGVRVDNELYVRPSRYPPKSTEILPWLGRR